MHIKPVSAMITIWRDVRFSLVQFPFMSVTSIVITSGHELDGLKSHRQPSTVQVITKADELPCLFLCSSTGQRSAAYASQLLLDGFSVRVLAGGVLGWTRAGLPLVDGQDHDKNTTRVGAS